MFELIIYNLSTFEKIYYTSDCLPIPNQLLS